MTKDAGVSLVSQAMKSIPTDLPLLLRAYGLKYAEDVLRGRSALIVPREKTDYVLLETNSIDGPLVKRAAVAYEIARWVLGRDKLLSQSEGRRTPGSVPKPVRHDTPEEDFRGTVDPSTGIETKRIQHLASEILVPRDNLKLVLSENGNNINEAAARFGVSRDLIRDKVRAHRLY